MSYVSLGEFDGDDDRKEEIRRGGHTRDVRWDMQPRLVEMLVR